MKKTPLLFTAIASLLVVASSFFALINSRNFTSGKATLEPYTIRMDTTHNANPHLSSYNTYYNFNIYSERNTEMPFRETGMHFGDNSCWGYVTSKFGALMNMNIIGGLNDITVTYSGIDAEYADEPNLSIRYGWECGYGGGLNKYADSLESGTTFNFRNLKPSYFLIEIEYAKIESIVIHFACEETQPEIADDEPHYELVTSVSEITSSNIYAIGSTTNGSGYMMSTAKRTDGSDDKIRMGVSISVFNGKVESNDSILRLHITETDGLYYFETLNYSQGDGHFFTNTNDKNELYIDDSNQTGFSLSINGDNQLIVTFTGTAGGKTYNKQLYYLPGTTAQFNMYTKAHDAVYLYKYVDVPTITKTLSYSDLTGMSKSYATGNYGALTTGGTKYEYYRTVRATNNSSGYAFSMLNPNFYYSDHGYPSSFYNISSSPIYGIKQISVTYSSSSGLKIGASVNYGDETYTVLPSTSGYETGTVNVSNANFFKVMTYEGNANIQNITISYTNVSSSYSKTATYSGNRKAYSVYSGSYTPGVTQKTMYISATETKTYTYYTYAYVNSHQSVKDDAAMIDPIDVCNYYEAFGCAPANYGTYNTFSGPLRDGVSLPTKNQVSSLFGSKARCISEYSRTDGYAQMVPYNNASGKSVPLYYEFDIDTDGNYSVTSRQVGRVVGWDYGFSCYSNTADHLPVCVYTDDHYATFQEYNNMGGFSPRFDAQRNLTGYVHTPLTNS